MIWRHFAERARPVLHLDCEQPLVRDWCGSAPLFLADLDRLLNEPTALFFDEVQHLEDAGLFVKGLVDRKLGVPILVTGSSSYHLGARTRESLAGRATRTRILPFSLAEICHDLGDLSEILREKKIRERFDRHIRFGGYPAVWLSEQPDVLLADLVEAFVLRDASDLFEIGRPDAFRRLLHLAARQAGDLVNFTEWSSALGIARETVARYLEILESAHIVVTLPPFAGGKRAEVTSRPKIFLVDPGLRNRLLHDFSPFDERVDRGPLLESWVFSELWKALPPDATLHFWRSSSKAEVDFVMVRGDKILAIEVKASALRRPKLSRSSRSFLEAYAPERFAIASMGLRHEERIDDVPVEWLQPWDLRARIEEIFPP